MQVFEAMTPVVVSVVPETSIVDAALVMKDLPVGPLPVVDCGRLVGVITDRDITVRTTAAGRDPYTTEVRQVMTREVVACHEKDDVRKAVLTKLAPMKERRRRAVEEAARKLSS